MDTPRIKISIKRLRKLDKELHSFRRRRRWLWLRHLRHWWWTRKNPHTTAATGKAKQLTKQDVDKMLKSLKLGFPQRLAVLISDTAAEALRKHTTPFPKYCPWSGIPVFKVDDEAYKRIDLDVNKAIVGPEDDIKRIRDILNSTWAGDTMLEWVKEKISKLEEMP